MTPLASLRAVPSLAVISPIGVLDGGTGNGNITGITGNFCTTDQILFNPTVTGGAGFSVANVPVSVNAGSPGMLAVDARL
jgi:hypothetical protein